MKVTIPAINSRYLWFGLALVLLGLDQISKLMAEAWLTPQHAQPLLPMLNLALTYNPGAAFSFLSQAGGWQRWFFIILSLAVSIILVIWLTRLDRRDHWTGIPLSLILAGAAGNLIDRIAYGHVIDFIDFFYTSGNGCLPLFAASGYGTCHWPTFNIADSAISVGAVLLIAGQFFEAKTGPRRKRFF